MTEIFVPIKPSCLFISWGILFAFGLFTAAGLSLAADDNTTQTERKEAPEYPLKLTIGWYDFSDKSRGTDVNLRYSNADNSNFWLGYFHLYDQGINQWRTGWDRTFGSSVRVTPSMQFASQGFIGGSFQVETGEPWFAGVGIGRTNLHPYWNLNFDPNDSYSTVIGHHGEDGGLIALQLVGDNRQNPDQRHLHFLYRQPIANGNRLTIDLLRKRGLVEEEMIHRWGISFTYDWPRFFIRVADDPKTNFTAVDMWRVVIGGRF